MLRSENHEICPTYKINCGGTGGGKIFLNSKAESETVKQCKSDGRKVTEEDDSSV